MSICCPHELIRWSRSYISRRPDEPPADVCDGFRVDEGSETSPSGQRYLVRP